MDFTTLLSLITLFYGAIYFTDYLLKSCLNLPYLYLLQNLGIQIQPFQINIFSTFFNRPISKIAVINKKLFKWWFSIGTVSVVLLLIPSIILLVKNLATQFSFAKVEVRQLVLQPVVPGINLPVDEFPYYFFTLLLASLFHEVGHAIAAVGEDVHINGIGFMLLFALPGAYVDLSKENLHNLSPFRQLKVLCAGVWHNIVLAVLAFCIGSYLPYILSPVFYTMKGVYIIGVDENSPVRGINGLSSGDIIESLNYCPVSNVEEWRECLILISKMEQTGYCIPEEIVHSHDETIQHSFARPDGSVECCDHKGGLGLCFELRENDSEDKGETFMQPYSCLPARIALSASSKVCQTSSQCTEIGSFCMAPSLKNSSRLIKIIRSHLISGNKTPAKDVLYLGTSAQFYNTVTATSYIPKFTFVPASLPRILEALLDYIIKFSGALGILNLIPCVYLDGYWISGAIIDLLTSKYCDTLSRKIIHVITTILGTALLILTIGVGLWHLL